MTDSREATLANTFVRLADTLIDDYDMIDLLDMLVAQCVALLDSDAGGLMIADPAAQDVSLELVVSTNEEAGFVEVNQLNAGSGPCIDCYTTGKPVSVRDIAADPERWPGFRESALENGFRSMHAFPMRLRGTVIGAMNLFSTRPGVLSTRDITVGQALADVATIGILQERSIRDQTVVTAQLQRALDSRVVIEQAKGVIAHSTGADMNEAFAMLREYARSHGRRLSEVASEVAERRLTITIGTFPRR